MVDSMTGNLSKEQKRIVKKPCLNVYKHASVVTHEGLETQIYYGERITVLDMDGDRVLVENEYDAYQGYCDIDDIMHGSIQNIQDKGVSYAWVNVPRTYIYPTPSIKSVPLMDLGYLSCVSVLGYDGKFAQLQDGGYIYAKHLSDHEHFAHDHVIEAQKFIGTPYLWGGRSGIALDCSSFVQLCLRACGIKSERDTGPQSKTLGSLVAECDDISLMVRGDIIFWKGHVAIYMGDGKTIHANATDMAVQIWDHARLVSYIKEIEAIDVSAIRRV